MSETAEILEFPSEPKGIGVRDFNALIKATIEGSLPGKYWVSGEVQGLNRNKFRNHWYFDLVDKDEGSEKTSSTLKAVIFQGRKTRINQKMTLAGAGELSDGMRVCLQGKVEVYIPSGTYQLIVEDIDPSFTLGDVLRQRRELMLKLEKEGLLVLNKTRPLPMVPLRIGLITSVGTQAYADFTGTLERSGFSFQVLVKDARMQGENTTKAVVTAITSLLNQNRLPLDVLVVCRGGGSVSDLSWFDHEAIARAIATCPLPVITGIGHTMDRSVADEVAHHCAVTPTDAAGYLISLAQEAQANLWELSADLERYVQHRLRKSELLQAKQKESFSGALGRKLSTHQHHLGKIEARFPPLARNLLERRANTLSHFSKDIQHQTTKRTSLMGQKLHMLKDKLGQEGIYVRYFLRKQEGLGQKALGEVVLRQLQLAEIRLKSVERIVQAHDPKSVLKKGYALLRDRKGQILKSKNEVLRASSIQAELFDGTVNLSPKTRLGLFEEEE